MIASAWLILGSLPDFLFAQKAFPAEEIIRAKVVMVPIDVIVTDAYGSPIGYLTREDFVVEDNGREREIAHFSSERLGRRPVSTTGLDGPAGEAPIPVESSEPQLSRRSHRTFVVVLGRGRHREGEIETLTRFIQDSLNPRDEIAVMAYNRATGFYIDRQPIVEVLRRYAKDYGAIESYFEGRGAIVQNIALRSKGVIPRTIQPKINAIFEIPAATVRPLPEQHQESRVDQDISSARRLQDDTGLLQGTPGMNDLGFPSENEVRNLDRARMELLTDLSFEQYITSRVASVQDFDKMFAAIQYLRFVEGEKHLLLLSPQGIVVPRVERELDLAELASDARVRIHTLQTGGVYVGMPQLNKWGPSLRDVGRSTLQFRGTFSNAFALSSVARLAELTGGRIYFGGVEEGLPSINSSTRSYYLLGYRISEEELDSTFHRIKVSVRRDDLKVYARSGYFARREPIVYDRESFLTQSRTMFAAGQTKLFDEISLSARITREHDTNRFSLFMTIQPREQMFASEGELHTGKLKITYFLLTEGGDLIEQQWDTLNMRLSEDTYRYVHQNGIPVGGPFELPGNVEKAFLKVVVYDLKNDTLGSCLVKIS